MSGSNESAHLEFVSTDDLLIELQKRFDSMFFIGYRNTSKTRDDYRCATNAPLHEILGLLEVAKNLAEANYAD